MVMSLRCDNIVAIAVLEEPGSRTKRISIYAETIIRQEMLGQILTLAHVSTDHLLADLLTKQTSGYINSIIFSQWGFLSFSPRC